MNKNKEMMVEMIVVMMINHHAPDKICSFLDLGFLSMIFFSAGSNPSAMAGSESVTRLSHKICTGSIGRGNHAKIVIVITRISSKFAESKSLTNFLILSYIALP